MVLKINNNTRNIVKTLALLLAVIPLVIVFLVVITSSNDSIVLFENYSPKISMLIMGFYFLLYLALIAFGIYWFITRLIAIAKIKNEQSKTELMLLKSQVSPHFFFNMLNNLYGLVSKDSKKAQDLILKLSDLMRYSIYEGEKETVTLSEEIDYLKNYIELHKMRYHKNIDIDFNYYVDENCKVVPLLFIMLLENSFKHGVETLRANAYVKVEINSFDNKIRFEVENNYDSAVNKKDKSGIGLENLKRRLELIYPNKHELLFSITDDVYKSQLTLEQL